MSVRSVLSAAAAVLLLPGCASITMDSSHPLRIDTKTTDGRTVVGADCRIANDQVNTTIKSGDTVPIRRSSSDLSIRCSHEGLPPANGKAISRANAGLVGNVVFGGLIGAVIDHSRGTAYTYPTWMILVFGRDLVFDRMHEVAGHPLTGDLPTANARPENPRQTLEQQHRW